MYQSEKQFNTTASEHTIEEVYTNLDIAPNDMYLPYEGYAFRYPQRWLDDPSQNKMIGIRKLTILPTRHIINYYFEVEKADDEKKNDIDKIIHSNSKILGLNKDEYIKLI